MSYALRLMVFALLFALLCATGSELCAVGAKSLGKGVSTNSEVAAAGDPQPLRSRALEFRGLTPVPPIADRLLPALSQADR